MRTTRLITSLSGALAAGAVLGLTASPASAVVGGTAAPAGAYDFTASLQDGDFAFCGGSVIAAQWVLTAAHCVPDGNASGLSVVVGTVDNSNGSGERRAVAEVLVHPAYDADASRGLMEGGAQSGDIAVALAVGVALTAVFAPLTTWLYQRS